MEMGNSLQEIDVLMNTIFQAYSHQLREIMKIHEDKRDLFVTLDEDVFISDDAGNRKPLFSINYNPQRIKAVVYKKVFTNAVFPMMNLSPDLWKRLVSEMAWHEYAHIITFPSEIDDTKCSYLALIYTDFLANYYVKNHFNQQVPCILAHLKTLLRFFKSSLNSMKRTVKKGFNADIKYGNLLFKLLEICNVFYINDAWNEIHSFFEQKKLLNYLKKINDFFLQVTELDANYVDKYKIINRFSSNFSARACFEILSQLLLERKEINFPSGEVMNQILQI